MIIYFADRQLNIIGSASTSLPDGLTVTDDKKTEDVETGVSIFECKIHFEDGTRGDVKRSVEVGNYLLRSNGKENEFYQIIETEEDTKKQNIYAYAEDDGMDLLNEVVGPYKADKAYNIAHYISKFASGSGFVIGVNEASTLTRKLSWDGEATAAERIASVATQFDNCEIQYSFDIKGLTVRKKYINIHKKRGQDSGVQLRLNYDIDSIITSKSIANLATALHCEGGTPDNAEDPITLGGYSYDDGDFYVENGVLKSREALKNWSRYLWKIDDSHLSGAHITKRYSYDTLSQSTLCAHAITKLKALRQIEVNYEVDIKKLPDNVRIGDRVNIIDDDGELYLSTRILTLETSVANEEMKAILGEYLIRNSGISQKVSDLAAQFSKMSISASRALSIANNAKSTADTAQSAANSAAAEAETAQQVASSAQSAANNAAQSAEAAQTAANNAQSAVDLVKQDVDGIKTTVSNAKEAAEQAQQAATTAKKKAEEAHTAATNAQSAANGAKTAADAAQKTADEAVSNASTAKSTADAAKTKAEAAATTAEAAKIDAEAAKADIDSLGENLTTIEDTMIAEYARKTDLTEAQASLQTQITKNAAEISSTASSVTRIDETANNAYSELQGALGLAERAQNEAAAAQQAANAAQAAADTAAKAATTAQAEADEAQSAANTAKTVLDNARSSLASAKEDLATVQARADATEEEIAAAQAAVTAAQTAVDTAKSDWKTAIEEADTAKQTASEAASNANKAQAIANKAAADAAIAQTVANEATGNASAAQTAANEAVQTAHNAQKTANQAVSEAVSAQATADTAAVTAAAAQAVANDAQVTATQAAADLAAAQTRLQEVLADVDATEEEIAAAQATVTAAQSAADTAANNATTAQQAADEAQANADNAQAAADNAKSAANVAQAEADEAQAAANEAKSIVYGLSNRVANAETNITQNAHAIALSATKKEVTQTLGGYYTKEETNAAINVSADSITQTVSTTYATKQSLAETDTKAGNAQTSADDNSERITTSESKIQQLAGMISMLVTDGNGASMMTQTADGGWTFSMGSIVEALSKAQNDVDALSGDVSETSSELATLKSTLDDLGVLADYVVITTYNGQPCIELGESENAFKLRITNTEIQFADGTIIPAYITNRKLMINQAEVKEEMQFGGFVWKVRDNDNLGLIWKGDE